MPDQKGSHENRLEHLAWLATDLIYDLVTPCKVVRDYMSQPSFHPGSAQFLGIIRMCKISTVLALTKLHDIIKNYGAELRAFPDDIRAQTKQFMIFAQSKKLVRLRNKFVAHNFDDFKESSYREGENIFDGIFGKSLQDHLDFFEWVSPENPERTFEKYHPSYLATRMRNHLTSIVSPQPRVPAPTGPESAAP